MHVQSQRKVTAPTTTNDIVHVRQERLEEYKKKALSFRFVSFHFKKQSFITLAEQDLVRVPGIQQTLVGGESVVTVRRVAVGCVRRGHINKTSVRVSYSRSGLDVRGQCRILWVVT